MAAGPDADDGDADDGVRDRRCRTVSLTMTISVSSASIMVTAIKASYIWKMGFLEKELFLVYLTKPNLVQFVHTTKYIL